LEHIQRTVFILLICSWGLLAAGLCVAVLRWHWTEKSFVLGEGPRKDLLKVWLMGKRIARRLGRRVAGTWATYRKKRRKVPIQFLIADDQIRRRLAPHLRTGLDRLALATGARLPADSAVLVQRSIEQDTQRTGLNQALDRPGQGPRILLRVALEVGGVARTTDQMLSTLAEQYLALISSGTTERSELGGEIGDPGPAVGASSYKDRPQKSAHTEPPPTRPQLVVVTTSREDTATATAAEEGPSEAVGAATIGTGDPLVGPAVPTERVG